MENLFLSDHERGTPVCKRLVKALTQELQHLREQNDKEKAPNETSHLRGRIHEVKEMLKILDEPVIKNQRPLRRRDIYPPEEL